MNKLLRVGARDICGTVVDANVSAKVGPKKLSTFGLVSPECAVTCKTAILINRYFRR